MDHFFSRPTGHEDHAARAPCRSGQSLPHQRGDRAGGGACAQRPRGADSPRPPTGLSGTTASPGLRSSANRGFISAREAPADTPSPRRGRRTRTDRDDLWAHPHIVRPSCRTHTARAEPLPSDHTAAPPAFPSRRRSETGGAEERHRSGPSQHAHPGGHEGPADTAHGPTAAHQHRREKRNMALRRSRYERSPQRTRTARPRDLRVCVQMACQLDSQSPATPTRPTHAIVSEGIAATGTGTRPGATPGGSSPQALQKCGTRRPKVGRMIGKIFIGSMLRIFRACCVRTTLPDRVLSENPSARNLATRSHDPDSPVARVRLSQVGVLRTLPRRCAQRQQAGRAAFTVAVTPAVAMIGDVPVACGRETQQDE
jgi:hypothetical protein